MPPAGTLVINTHYTPEYMVRFVPGADRLAQLVCVEQRSWPITSGFTPALVNGPRSALTEGAAERGKRSHRISRLR